MKKCKWCNTPLEKRPEESQSSFNKRDTCNKEHAAKYRQAVRSKR